MMSLTSWTVCGPSRARLLSSTSNSLFSPLPIRSCGLASDHPGEKGSDVSVTDVELIPDQAEAKSF